MTLTIPAVDPIAAHVEALEQRVSQLEQQLLSGQTAGAPSLTEAVRSLRDLFEYAVLRPVDLVKLDGHPYFFYTKDLLYTLFTEHMPETFIRNYRLTADDLLPQRPHSFSLADYLERVCRQSPRNEHFAKLRIMAQQVCQFRALMHQVGTGQARDLFLKPGNSQHFRQDVA